MNTFAVATGEPPPETLPAEVSERELAVGVLTHSPKPYAETLLKNHGITVEAMVTGSDGYPPKPDPAGLKAVADELGVAPGECVYVGDAVGDFGAAAAAGMRSIGVAWGREAPVDWRHGWPDVAVTRPSRLLSVIDGNDQLGPLGEVVATSTMSRRQAS